MKKELIIPESESEVAQSCPTLCDPMDCSLSGSSVLGIFQARVPFPSPGDLPDPGIERGSPALQAGTLPSEPPGKPVIYTHYTIFGPQCGSDGKASAHNVGDLGSIPGLGRSPGEGNGNPSSILAWKIPWMEEPGRLQAMGSQRVGHD